MSCLTSRRPLRPAVLRATTLVLGLLLATAPEAAAQVSRITPGRVVLEPTDRASVRLDGRGLDGYSSARIVDRRGNEVSGSTARLSGVSSTTATLNLETRGVREGSYRVQLSNRRGVTAIDLEVVVQIPNRPPAITDVTAPGTVYENEAFEILVTATDDQGLDRVVASWSGGSRTVDMSGRSATARIPFQNGLGSSTSVQLRVVDTNGLDAVAGAVQIGVQPNQPPVVTGVQGPNLVRPGEPFELSISATDERGLDRVEVTWPGGSRTAQLSGTSGTARVSFDAGVDETATFGVRVFDANGGDAAAQATTVPVQAAGIASVVVPSEQAWLGYPISVQVSLESPPFQDARIQLSTSSAVRLEPVTGGSAEVVIAAGSLSGSGDFVLEPNSSVQVGTASVTASRLGQSRTVDLAFGTIPRIDRIDIDAGGLPQQGVLRVRLDRPTPADLEVWFVQIDPALTGLGGGHVIPEGASFLDVPFGVTPRDVTSPGGDIRARLILSEAFGVPNETGETRTIPFDFTYPTIQIGAGTFSVTIGPVDASSGGNE